MCFISCFTFVLFHLAASAISKPNPTFDDDEYDDSEDDIPETTPEDDEINVDGTEASDFEFDVSDTSSITKPSTGKPSLETTTKGVITAWGHTLPTVKREGRLTTILRNIESKTITPKIDAKPDEEDWDFNGETL